MQPAQGSGVRVERNAALNHTGFEAMRLKLALAPRASKQSAFVSVRFEANHKGTGQTCLRKRHHWAPDYDQVNLLIVAESENPGVALNRYRCSHFSRLSFTAVTIALH